jgi:hypothetical protein
VTLTGAQRFTASLRNGTLIVDCVNGAPQLSGGVFYFGQPGTNTLTVAANGLTVQAVPNALTIGGSLKVDYSNANATTTNVNGAAAVNAMAGPDTADRATAFGGLTANERFVQALYLDELGRAGSKAELDGWAAMLNGTASAQFTVALDIQHNAEARDHLVKSWYVAFLGRQAGGGEEQGWVNKLLVGQTEELVLSQILASQEFYNRSQTLISTGTTDQRFAQALYQLLLDRAGSSAEISAQAGLVPSQGRTAVALGILSSQEFRTDDFEGYYNALLHRPADSAGLSNWVMPVFNIGAVRVDMEGSAEFFTFG